MRLAVLFIVGLACYGQIHNLATTDDGRQLYFSSPQRLIGTSLDDTAKIFRLVDSGFELFAYTGPRSNTPFAVGFGGTICCELDYPGVTGDGRKVAYVRYSYCWGGGRCSPEPSYSSFVKDTEDKSFLGRYTLNPTGRYMLSYPPIVSVLDTTTGVSTSLSPYKITGRGNQAIASDGSVLVVDSGSRTLSLWRSGAVRTIDQRTTAQGSINAAHISANGSVGVSTFWLGNDAYQLISHDISSGRSILLGRTIGTEPSLSADGSLVAYLDKAPDGRVQAYLQRTDGTARRVLTAENGNVSEVVISGFGNVVYSIGARGRLLRIDTGTFAVTEVVKVPPSISPFSTVPGALFSVSKEILYPGTTGVSINGRAAPLVASNDSRLTFQVPWETAAEKYALYSAAGIETPFENATQSQVVTSVPTFAFLDTGGSSDSPGYILALHEDFGSVVSPQNPSSPGEVVHVFLTGLGPVTPSIATGVVTPFGPLHRAIAKVNCRLGSSSNNLEVLFAGLAPGFVGLNQLDLKLPDPLPTSDEIYCGGDRGRLAHK